MTQEQLGLAVGVTKQAIYQWEKNLNKTFKAKEFDLLIAALNTTKAYLNDGLNNYSEKTDDCTNIFEPSNQYANGSKKPIVAKNEDEENLVTIYRKLLPSQSIKLLEYATLLSKDADQLRAEQRGINSNE